ncbi:unnamed protein product [Caenorhabditis auriculariae]|uniref:Uncharacterized protein n=1 Tax=Caenorhabditis auriculariae TaxID=2777116 RepID=A0A8S1HPS6_9PELO|nr:unnamed protein product [Caenorhabditis auriculariae]
MQDFLFLQSTLAFVMLIITAIAGFSPMLVLKMFVKNDEGRKPSSFLSYLSCFSGGVFLATCFLDIIPHVNEGYEDLLTRHELSWHFPLPQLVTCCGFFFIYSIEEFATYVFAGRKGGSGVSHGHAHHGDAPVIRRRKSSLNITNLAVEETSMWVVSDEKSNILKSLTFAMAMSFHSLLEGFALGVQESSQRIYSLFFSLLLHKGVEAFSVGLHLQISNSKSQKYKVILSTIFIYCLMAPIGTIVGTLLQHSDTTSIYKDSIVLFLESLAAGTFIYVTFIEIMATERSIIEANHLLQLFSIVIGFALITAMQAIFGHDHSGHSHAHGHDHDHHHHEHEEFLNGTIVL